MLKINKINILIFFAAALLICGCRTVPQGNPPSEIVNIRQTAENSEPISLAEAVNMAATELAVNVFPQKGEIKILFKRNPVGNEVTRRLYRELNVSARKISFAGRKFYHRKCISDHEERQ